MSPVMILSLILGIVLDHVNGQFCNVKNFTFFYQKYDQNGTKVIEKHINKLPTTPVNEYFPLGDLCLDDNGLPEVLHCLETQEWEERENVICQTDISKSSKFLKTQLDSYENSNFRSISSSNTKIIANICTEFNEQNHSLIPFDVVNLDRLVKVITFTKPHGALGAEMINLYSLLMATNQSVLKLSARLNATNSLLFNFEKYMNGLAQILLSSTLTNEGVVKIVGEKLSVFFVYPELSKYTGIAIYSKASPNRLGCDDHNFYYRFLYANQSLDELKNEADLHAATFLTDELWRALKSDKVKCLVFKVYVSDALFVDTSMRNGTGRPGSYVLSINIPGTSNNSLPHPLAFVLHNENYRKLETDLTIDYCGYWDYGSWSNLGVTTNTSSNYNDQSVVCYTTHLTQFSFLVGGSCLQLKCENAKSETLLDTITAVGCGLSMLGLSGIWLTAALFKRWRSLHSTKLLLNLSLAMTILFVLMFITYVNQWLWKFSFARNSIQCIAVGALLQFSVLLLFSWMLVIGYLQYRRFVAVFIVRSEHLVMNAVVIAWTLPLVPTILLLCLDLESYSPLSFDFTAESTTCYPSGKGLAYAVVLPIGLVVIANVATLVCIFYKTSKLRNRKGILLLQIRLFILLFFLLGLTWIFGICTYFGLGFVFSVLFCATATIQGFVLFVFFVIFDEVARKAWLQVYFRPQRSSSFQISK